MSRRGSPAVQVLIVVVVVLFFLYGFYSYHEQHTRLKHLEETSEKCKLKTESLSAQLQVLYEHKTRLESTIQKEKELHKGTKEELDLKIKELENELGQVNEEKNSLSSELLSVKKTFDDTKINLEKAETDLKSSQQQHNNEVAALRDDLANCQRRYEECAALKEPQVVASDRSINEVQKDTALGQKSHQPIENLQVKPPDGVKTPIEVESLGVVKAVDAADSNNNNIRLQAADESSKLIFKAIQPAEDHQSLVAEADQNKQSHNNDAQFAPRDQNHPQQNIDQENRNPEDNSQQVDNSRNEQQNKVIEDYNGDIEKPQQQKADDQIANPVANGDLRQADADTEQVGDDKDGAGL